MTELVNNKFLDVEKILDDKNPNLKKWLPNFMVNYLKKILHQEDINGMVSRNKNKFGTEFSGSLIKEFNLNIELVGAENIPKKGNITVTSNHPLGGLDAIGFISKFGEHRSDYKVIVNDVLLGFKNLRTIFIGVNKLGKTSEESYKEINTLFANDSATVIFPAGMVSRKTNGKIEDLKWKRTFIFKAKENNNPIIPVYIDGKLSSFFYRLSNFRRKIGIKANIEKLFLSNEQFKLKGKTIRIIVGKPIYPKDFDTNKTDFELAQEVKKAVYELENDKNK
jgi:1-acyl-sn-glycerol-3-phosphate acyltransferase